MSGIADPPPVSREEFAGLTAQLGASIPLGPFSVTGASGVPALPAASAEYLGRSATVVDLFGNRYSRVRCERVDSLHFWQPLSSDSFGSVAAATATLRPLTVPQTIQVTGSVPASTTRTLSLDTAGGWPGCVKEFSSGPMTMGLGAALNIAGTGLGSAVGLLLGGYRKFGLEYAGGQLAWRQLV